MTKKNSLICKKDFVKKTLSNSHFGRKLGLKLPFIAYKFLQHSDTLEGSIKVSFSLSHLAKMPQILLWRITNIVPIITQTTLLTKSMLFA
jgi:hypothetical protein